MMESLVEEAEAAVEEAIEAAAVPAERAPSASPIHESSQTMLIDFQACKRTANQQNNK